MDSEFRAIRRPEAGIAWCSVVELEAALCEHPSVYEAAVVGRADADGALKPAAWIVLRGEVRNLAALESSLVLYCKARLAADCYPHWFEFVAALPKTATGKTLRHKLLPERELEPA
jgi:acyl-coenzyme A synthetase/AMP-(fatty) acid ligase